MTKENFEEQRVLASFLDKAASHAEMIGRVPATSKQCWFIAGLILKTGDDGSEWITNTSAMLTKSKASKLIESYLQEG
jgi:hypothetical protein